MRSFLAWTGRRTASLALIGLAGALAAAAGTTAATAQDAAARATLIVELRDLRNDGGVVRCGLYGSREGFPSDSARATARTEGRPASRRATCRFENVAAGGYAVSIHHDEDGDGVFDTGIFGIPMEGVGASRDAHGTMGPPSWQDARIDVPAGESRIVVHVVYPM